MGAGIDSVRNLPPQQARLTGEDEGFSLASGVYFTSDPTGSLWRLAESAESAVFEEAGYVDGLDELREEYAQYVNTTQMVVAVAENKPVAAIRLISGKGQIRPDHFDKSSSEQDTGIKTIEDIRRGRLDLSTGGDERLGSVDLSGVIEVGSIAILEEYRRSRVDKSPVIFKLYSEIFRVAIEQGKPHVIASFDEAYLNRFKQEFGDHLIHELGAPVEYMGSPTVPVLMDVREVVRWLATTRPSLLRMLGIDMTAGQ